MYHHRIKSVVQHALHAIQSSGCLCPAFIEDGKVPSRHGGTLSSCQAASTLVRLVAGDERWETPDPTTECPPSELGRTELNRTVTCMVLKATANDRRTSSPLS
ncbi:hypothetical protein TNCV_2219811 [Trichonephila clavipes]|nr:hypothetical protein TNCV_2219811 [Trichonephila clavipes]